jgi:hypothetical protein
MHICEAVGLYKGIVVKDPGMSHVVVFESKSKSKIIARCEPSIAITLYEGELGTTMV